MLFVNVADEKIIEPTPKEGAVSFYTTMAATESNFVYDNQALRFKWQKSGFRAS